MASSMDWREKPATSVPKWLPLLADSGHQHVEQAAAGLHHPLLRTVVVQFLTRRQLAHTLLARKTSPLAFITTT
jgi:hypothetical protein